MARKPDPELTVVERGAGWWTGEVVRQPAAAMLDPAKVAQAEADAAALRKLMGF